MKLAAKLVTVILLATIGLVAIDGYLTVRREVKLFDTDLRRDARLLGQTMGGLVVDAWQTGGQQRALRMIADANDQEHPATIRWVWLDSPPGDPHGPRASRELLEPLRRGHDVSVEWREDGNNEMLCTYVPIDVDEQRSGALELTESLSERNEYTRTTVFRVFVLSGTLLLVNAVAVFFLGIGMVGRPLRRLIEKTRRVGTGDLTGPLRLHGHDELTELAAALNEMCENLAEANQRVRAETAARIATLQQLRHADRLTTVGQLASGMAHELGTPLNVVSGRAGMIADGDLSETEIVESANIIRAQSGRMTTIIRQLLDFARRPSPKQESVNLREAARRTLDLLASLARRRNVTLSLESEDTPSTVLADAGQMQQVLTNLVVNAVQAMPRSGEVRVNIRRGRARPPAGHEGSEGHYVCVEVQDEGEGISEENMGRLFEPFFTTKDVGEGSGLGLSIAYGIIRDHGGWIEVKSELGKGSCFSVYLPQEGD